MTAPPLPHHESVLNASRALRGPIAATTFEPMAEHIPPDAKTLVLPHIGEVILYRAGSDWVAVWPDFQDPEKSPVGAGSSPGEAVAELVAQE